MEYRATLGAHGASLGESAIVLPSNPLSIYYNPAALGFMQQGGALADYSKLFGATLYEGAVAAASPLPLPYFRDRQFGLGLMVNFEGFDDSELRHGRFLFYTAAGLPLTPWLALGAGFKIARVEAQLENADRQGITGNGAGLDLSAHFQLPFKPQNLVRQVDLAVAAYDIYNTHVTYQDTTSDILFERAVRAGAAILFRDFTGKGIFPTVLLQFDDRWHVGGEVTLLNKQAAMLHKLALRAGYAHDLGAPGEEVFTFGFGLHLGEHFANVQFDYAYIHPGFLPDRHLFTISAPMFKGPEAVAIAEPEIVPIFASCYRAYADPIAAQANSVQIENLTQTPLIGTFSLLETRFGLQLDEKAMAPVSLRPGERRTVRLPLVLTNNLLKEARGLSQPAPAKLRFEYTMPHSTKRRRADKQITLVVHGKNYIVWDELGREAAFITPANEQVLAFRERAATALTDRVWRHYRPIYRAAQFYEALVENGFGYLPDTQLPFDSLYAKRDFDRVKYPGEMLVAEGGSRRGDCDDLTALYCSLLESDNIATAIVGTSDHLLMLFDTGLHVAQRHFLPLPDSLLFSFKATVDLGLAGHLWLPVEVTAIGDSVTTPLPFGAAVAQAASYIRRMQKSDSLFEIISTALAQTKFPPEQNPPGISRAPILFKDASARVKNALAGLDRIRQNYQRAVWAEAKQAGEAEFAAATQYALLAIYLEKDSAADSVFQRLQEKFSSRYELLNNQGNLELLRFHYDRAAQLYEKALQLEPDFLQGYLNRIILHQAMIEARASNDDSLRFLIARDSLRVAGLYEAHYRDAGLSLLDWQGLAFLQAAGRGKQENSTGATAADTLKAAIGLNPRQEKNLMEKTGIFFVKLSRYLSPPDPRPRRKFDAGGRGTSPVLQSHRLLEMLYWCTPQTYTPAMGG